ncbi:hypothetical protein [Paenibacillus glucanolyticus]|uniref:hypothetical protein n=1 Tax=Paenibacillus glucanolyticus TaxID=59843 RepID=UPI00096BE481|nr:hypothetical protein [Paenibacillus glucanolyticus]OMF76717.1 hypothetical protein BK142_14445 [Paenibacillus glucanolyticus]
MNIIDTIWWNAIGVILFFGVIVVCLYCLWDLKREQSAAEALVEDTTTSRAKTETRIYIKPPMYIYPNNQEVAAETGSPKGGL